LNEPKSLGGIAAIMMILIQLALIICCYTDMYTHVEYISVSNFALIFVTLLIKLQKKLGS